jgi:hypothetical protein
MSFAVAGVEKIDILIWTLSVDTGNFGIYCKKKS